MGIIRPVAEIRLIWGLVIDFLTDECKTLIEDVQPELNGTIFCPGLFQLQGRAVSFFYKA